MSEVNKIENVVPRKARKKFPDGFLIVHKTTGNSEVPDCWKRLDLDENHIYYYDCNVAHLLHESNGEDRAVLQGSLYPTPGTGRVPSLREILSTHRSNPEAFYAALRHLGGRWTLTIVSGGDVIIYHDSSGSRTVYYDTRTRVVGSHAHLVAKASQAKPWATSLDINDPVTFWDRTPYPTVKGLLPNFSLELRSGNLSRYWPREENPYRSWTYSQKLDLLETLWEEQLLYILKEHPDAVFSVTGGLDSRVTLALLGERAKRLSSFTYTVQRTEASGWHRSLAQDYQSVRPIVHEAALDHQVLTISPSVKINDFADSDTLEKNSLVVHGPKLISMYNEKFGPARKAHIQSNLLELGRAYWITDTSRNDLRDVKQHMDQQTKKKNPGFSLDSDKFSGEFYSKANEFDYTSNAAFKGYHILDMYYWEVRLGRWLAETLNESDSAFLTVLPLNTRAMFEVMLSFELPERRVGASFSDIINRRWPVLNFYGVNEDRNLYERRRDNLLSKIRCEHNDALQTMTVYDDGQTLLEKLSVTGRQVYLPKGHFVLGNYSQLAFECPPGKNYCRLSLDSSYVNGRALKMMEWSVRVEETLVAHGDLAYSDAPIDISVHAQPGQSVFLRVTARSTQDSQLWERASRVRVRSIDWLSVRTAVT